MEQNEQPTGGDADQFTQSSLYDSHIHAPASLMSNTLESLGLEDDSALEQSTLSSLVQALDDPSWQVRTKAVRKLASFGEQAPIELLVAGLSDEHRAVRVASALTLGELGRQVSSEPLIAALRDPDWQVRAAAVQALGMLHEQFSIEVLVPSLSDVEAIVRASALRALARFGERGRIDLLVTSLHDTSWLVREIATLVMGELGRNAPLEPLLIALKDENRCVREAVQMSLEQSYPEALSMLLPGLISPSDKQQTNHILGLSEQGWPYQEKEAYVMHQTEQDGQLRQQEQHKPFTDSQVSVADLSEGATETYQPRHEQARSTTRRSRLFSLVNGIAAVLVVGLIIGGALLLFTNHHPHIGSSSPGATATRAALPGGCFDSSPSIRQFCAQNLFKLVNLSKKIGDYTITLEGVYADANRVIIAHTLWRNSDHKLFWGDFTDSTLITQQGTRLRVDGGSGLGDPKHNTALQATFFDTTSLPEETRELSLHLTINRLILKPMSGTPSPNPIIHGPITFDFTVLFHPGRVVNLHKALNVGGASVTLERIVLTPSDTRFYLQGAEISDAIGAISLSLIGRNADWIDGAGGFGQCVQPNNENIILDYGPFFDYHGAATLTISDPCGKYGPWIFHFVIP